MTVRLALHDKWPTGLGRAGAFLESAAAMGLSALMIEASALEAGWIFFRLFVASVMTSRRPSALEARPIPTAPSQNDPDFQEIAQMKGWRCPG